MPDLQPDYMQQHWFAVLRDAVATYGVKGVASKLGYSNHTGTSLVMRGRYPADITSFARRVQERLGKVACPYLNQAIDLAVCQKTATGLAPLHNPMKRQHWSACQSCPQHPQPTHPQPSGGKHAKP